MTWIPVRVPKPKARVSQPRKGLQRGKPMKKTRMKCGAASKRRGKSSFPGQRDKPFCRFVVTEPCILAGRFTLRRISLNDRDWQDGAEHRCWGPRDPMHVGEHRAQGAADFGRVVSACRATHDLYDQNRPLFHRVTRVTEKQLENKAAGLALKYVERGGVPVLSGKETA
jgi:hypothetical protein